ncbi:MAG: FkbM family methyltransferase, partial [bacterium]|nr:FkbM family methyltransferase [bacterium]
SGVVKLHYDSTAEQWFSSASLHPGAWNGAQKTAVRSVPAVSLRSILEKQHFDLVKLDIEGAELGVLSAAKQVLQSADNYLVEVHEQKDNKLQQLQKLFAEQGFTTTSQQLTNNGLALLRAERV